MAVSGFPPKCYKTYTCSLYWPHMAVSGSCQNVIKLTLALSIPTIPVGRQTERETGLGKGGISGGRESSVPSINPTIIIGKLYG